MSIGTPTFAGFTTFSAASMQSTVDVPAGALVVIQAFGSTAGQSLTGLTASDGTNSYTLAATSPALAGIQATGLLFASDVSAIPSGTTFTPSGAAGAAPFLVSIAYVVGANGGLDVENSINTASTATSLSLPTGTLSGTNDITFGALTDGIADSAFATFTEGVGFTSLYDTLTTGVGAFDLAAKVITTNTTWAPSWTQTPENSVSAVIAAFMATPIFGWEAQGGYVSPRKRVRFKQQTMRGDDGIVARFNRFIPLSAYGGVQPPIVRYKRPRPVGWPDWNEDGDEAPFVPPVATTPPFVENRFDSLRWPTSPGGKPSKAMVARGSSGFAYFTSFRPGFEAMLPTVPARARRAVGWPDWNDDGDQAPFIPSVTAYAALDFGWTQNIARKRKIPVGWSDWNEDGNEFPTPTFVSFAENKFEQWRFPSRRQYAIGDGGINAIFHGVVIPSVWGHEQGGLTPKRRRNVPSLIGNESFAALTGFVPYVYESVSPFIAARRRLGAIFASGDTGTEATIVPPIPPGYTPYLFDQPNLLRTWRRFKGGAVRGTGGGFAYYKNSLPFIYEAVLPTLRRAPVFRGGGIFGRAQFAIPSAFFPVGWEIAPPIFSRSLRYRGAGLVREDEGIEKPYVPTLIPLNWGYEQTPAMLRFLRLRAGIFAASFPIEAKFVPPPLTPAFAESYSIAVTLRRPTWNRAGAFTTRAAFAVPGAFNPWGWEIQAPAITGRLRRGGWLAGGDSGAEASFKPTLGIWGWEPVNGLLRAPKRQEGAIVREPPAFPFSVAKAPIPFFQAELPELRLHLARVGALAGAVEALPARSFIPMGWEAIEALTRRPLRLEGALPRGDEGLPAFNPPVPPYFEATLPVVRKWPRLAPAEAVGSFLRPLAAFHAVGWEIAPPMVLRPARRYSFTGEQGIEERFIPPVPPPAFVEQLGGVIVPIRRPRIVAAIAGPQLDFQRLILPAFYADSVLSAAIGVTTTVGPAISPSSSVKAALSASTIVKGNPKIWPG